MIAGNDTQQSFVWSRSTDGWIQATLPTDVGTRVQVTGISSGGTVIVGRVVLSLEPGEFEPVVWIAGGGGWTLERLQGSGVPAGSAYDVETLTDGRTVVVGSVDDGSDSNAESAVAWVRAPGAPSFGSPIRLEPISRGYSATAKAVNVKGQIVGEARTKGVSSVAVMWKLP